MSSTTSYRCTSSPMEEPNTEIVWSECFQDLGSWCHQPQDELNTPNVINPSEFKFSFDEQSMYNPWEANSSSVELKGDMWKPEADVLSLHFPSDEKNNPLMQIINDNQGASDTGIRYSCNLVLTPGIDQSTTNCHTEFKPVTWNDTLLPPSNINKSHSNISTFKRQNIPPNETIAMNKPKQHLKLNIAAANTKAPPASDLADTLTMNTPDVMNSLMDDSNFNIISFVEGYDDHLMVDPNTIVSQRPKETQITTQQVKIDHDYAEMHPSRESVIPQTLNEVEEILPSTIEDGDDFKPYVAVKEEPSSPAPSTSTNLGKRLRKIPSDEAYVYDDDPPSDSSSDWSPIVKKRAKNARKKAGEVSRGRTSSVSDSGSVTSGPDKYRQLRDRNNEASRRSRLNRKQKEVEMLDRANFLQRNNEVLRARAESLEQRVKELRNILLKVVLEKNK